jgi:hypothetical protein
LPDIQTDNIKRSRKIINKLFIVDGCAGMIRITGIALGWWLKASNRSDVDVAVLLGE